MLDASKTFNWVHYGKLFNILRQRNLQHTVTRRSAWLVVTGLAVPCLWYLRHHRMIYWPEPRSYGNYYISVYIYVMASIYWPEPRSYGNYYIRVYIRDGVDLLARPKVIRELLYKCIYTWWRRFIGQNQGHTGTTIYVYIYIYIYIYIHDGVDLLARPKVIRELLYKCIYTWWRRFIGQTQGHTGTTIYVYIYVMASIYWPEPRSYGNYFISVYIRDGVDLLARTKVIRELLYTCI